MSYDFFAHHPITNQQSATQLDKNLAPYSRMLLFGQCLLSRDKDKIRQKNYKPELSKLVTDNVKSLMASLGLDTPKKNKEKINLSGLPLGSFFISFRFRLIRPYISRDDEPFYIIDNPVVKDKIFKRPMVRPTGWKGALRHAIRLQNQPDSESKEQQLLNLFGSANDSQPKDGKQGSLHFYPTYFDKVYLEIINPHKRETKAGTIPVQIECVPIGEQGMFTLLYTPVNCIGQPESEIRKQVFADLQLVTEGLEAMFTVYGFGAKISSGFGVAEMNGQGSCVVNIPEAVEPSPPPKAPIEPQSIREIRKNYPDGNFTAKPKAWRKQHDATNSDMKTYRDAKAAWLAFQQQLATYQAQLAEWEENAAAPTPPVTTRQFTSFTDLLEIATNFSGAKEQTR